MSDPLIEALRAVARAALPEGAMLRRDRGEALYITDAPRHKPDAGWQAGLEAAGFRCAVEGGLARLTPDGRWAAALAARFPEPPDDLSARLRRFDGPPDDASLRLFCRALKALEGGEGDPGFDRALRQRAAVCLRRHAGGGGLYACALARHLIKTASIPHAPPQDRKDDV